MTAITQTTERFNPYLRPETTKVDLPSLLNISHQRALHKARAARKRNIESAIVALTQGNPESFGILNHRLPRINSNIDQALNSIMTSETFHQGVRYSMTLTDPVTRNKCLQVCMSKLIHPEPLDPTPWECLAAISERSMQRTCLQWFNAASTYPKQDETASPGTNM